MIEHKFAIIGLGQFGGAIARTLAQRGAEVLAIDQDERHVDEIADSVANAIALDATDKKALLSVDITSFDAVVVAIGEDFEQLLLTTTLLMELGVKRIIARARGRNQKIILQKIGVEEILSPEDEVGAAVAEKLVNPSIISYLELPDAYSIMEIICPPAISGCKLSDIDLRRRYHINLITIKKVSTVNESGFIKKVGRIAGIPHGETVVEGDDFLVLFGKRTDLERFIKVNQ
ncbi:potassium channel family protein [Alkaliflexus imshenetskii]|uniref:potassium channel family protein n=1 Tax=Alkaliflexus imshenetskii TaxID=286730 RepID=UPI0004AF3E43|nr:TrkA family potassium uptake protein [Alkaliflexus imshenetskii]